GGGRSGREASPWRPAGAGAGYLQDRARGPRDARYRRRDLPEDRHRPHRRLHGAARRRQEQHHRQAHRAVPEGRQEGGGGVGGN
ncbi:MAG: putative periplasmic protein kinase ArgK and related GTPases of G3E family, partial [uncultured Rubrobacteraceae bacterium]